MSEEQVQAQEVNDNQTDSTDTEQPQETADKQGTEGTQEGGATEETVDKPEFADDNMQKKFTQRMQEISEKEKQYNKAIKQAEAFQELIRDREFIDWHNKRTGKVQEKQEEPIPEISEDEFYQAQSSKETFQKLIDNRSKTVAERAFMPIIDKLQNTIATMRLEQDINDFASAKDDSGNLKHPDFWDLDSNGKLEPYLVAFKNSNMTGLQKLEAAYRLASTENVQKSVTEKAHKLVEEKKQAVTPRGTKQAASVDTSKMSMSEFARYKAKELGIDVP